jgi:hypothetical protein
MPSPIIHKLDEQSDLRPHGCRSDSPDLDPSTHMFQRGNDCCCVLDLQQHHYETQETEESGETPTVWLQSMVPMC